MVRFVSALKEETTGDDVWSFTPSCLYPPAVLNVTVPSDGVPGSKITTVASSGDEVVFTLPKGVAPGTRLQMIPMRQVMKRGAASVGFGLAAPFSDGIIAVRFAAEP